MQKISTPPSSDSSLILNSPRISLNNFKRGSYLSYDLQCINSCLRFSKFKWIWESVSFFNLVASNYLKNLFNCPVKVALTKIILGISWFDSFFSYYFTYIVFMYDWITSPYPESKKVSASSITRKQLLLMNTSLFFLCLSNLSIVVIRMSTPLNSFSFSWEYFFEFDKEYIINLAKWEIFFPSSSNYYASSLFGTKIIARGRCGKVKTPPCVFSWFFKASIIGSIYERVLPVPF